MIEREFAMIKLGKGDWLLVANDGETLWRISRYADDYVDGKTGATVHWQPWGCWRCESTVAEMETASDREWLEWDRWDFWCGGTRTRAEAIQEALRTTQEATT